MATKKTSSDPKTKLSSSHTRPLKAAKPKASAAKPARPAKAKAAKAPKASAAAKPRAAAKPKSQRPAPTRDDTAEPKGLADARKRALEASAVGLDKKALDVAIVDVHGRVDYADYLVLMSGTSDRHVASLVQAIEEELKKRGHRALSVEGMGEAQWVLVDYGDVVVHVFQGEARALYDLDGLWMDAGRLPLPGRAGV